MRVAADAAMYLEVDGSDPVKFCDLPYFQLRTISVTLLRTISFKTVTEEKILDKQIQVIENEIALEQQPISEVEATTLQLGTEVQAEIDTINADAQVEISALNASANSDVIAQETGAQNYAITRLMRDSSVCNGADEDPVTAPSFTCGPGLSATEAQVYQRYNSWREGVEGATFKVETVSQVA
ncbi:hypothetical protein KIPB_010013 [Kipferlia bialata]|uniref:Uncharacterized protein n=1 Tax=Kipferlia bialata TaxID=797122 RepID=A0A9K3D2L8_9EUKA|nr:hypothetical protein KIPB_010013 [Kipferlia bialata]|eukprot:g10013.t1